MANLVTQALLRHRQLDRQAQLPPRPPQGRRRPRIRHPQVQQGRQGLARPEAEGQEGPEGCRGQRISIYIHQSIKMAP